MTSVPVRRNSAGTLATILLATPLVYLTFRFVNWAVVHAIWSVPPGAGSSICRAARGEGACWAVVTERLRFILLGLYPIDQQWRPALVCVLFVALYAASAVRAWWPQLIAFWIAGPIAAIALLRGGLAGLPAVPTDFWGGLPLTFILSTVGFAAATPLGVALALGRRSGMPAIRVLSIAYIEVVRGVPLITFLFIASLVFPLFMPEGVAIDKLLRTQIVLVMVIAAYLAEVIRGGLQAVPAGQYEAAISMGLSFWPATILVVLPQALRATIPALVNTFIAVFKDTSLVAVIGLFDLLGAAKTVIVDPRWTGFGVEVYLFAAFVYFAFCFTVSRCSRRLEQILTARQQQ